VLIYVFDITSSEWEKDVHYFEDNLQALRENSADAGIWVLINKMDLVDKEDPKRLMLPSAGPRSRHERAALGRRRQRRAVQDLPTSIWDESLYKVGVVGSCLPANPYPRPGPPSSTTSSPTSSS
jgi:Ras-related GTP-binding protein A/B